ncbi:MAG: DUF5678 domain-containing protein [Candidatus Omnitrophica bacterium]|nr:DUF5678 domain-containing protein [Candidatus Omnitrophota bacterium]
MIQTLLKENSYNGKFVAFKDFNDHTVIGDGNTPQQALEKAAKRGFVNPVVTFIPIKGMVQIY